jgi:excisionase family DNA binding protein
MTEVALNGSLASLEAFLRSLITEVAQQAVQQAVTEINGTRRADEPYLTAEQAAKYLACEPKRIYELVAQGRLPRRKDGRRLLFRLEELEACLETSLLKGVPCPTT